MTIRMKTESWDLATYTKRYDEVVEWAKRNNAEKVSVMRRNVAARTALARLLRVIDVVVEAADERTRHPAISGYDGPEWQGALHEARTVLGQ